MKKLNIRSGTTRANRCGLTLSAFALVCLAVPNASASDQETFTTIDVPGASDTFGQGINDRGDIVGEYDSNGMSHGFLLSGGTFTTIDFPGATSGRARGINRHGDIVGLYVIDGMTHGYLLSRGEYFSIDVPGASFTGPRDINRRGDIVGRYDSGGMTHGFLLSNGNFSTIDFPGATLTRATAISPRLISLERPLPSTGGSIVVATSWDGTQATV
jgi:uncharacterized membrane protein